MKLWWSLRLLPDMLADFIMMCACVQSRVFTAFVSSKNLLGPFWFSLACMRKSRTLSLSLAFGPASQSAPRATQTRNISCSPMSKHRSTLWSTSGLDKHIRPVGPSMYICVYGEPRTHSTCSACLSCRVQGQQWARTASQISQKWRLKKNEVFYRRALFNVLSLLIFVSGFANISALNVFNTSSKKKVKICGNYNFSAKLHISLKNWDAEHFSHTPWNVSQIPEVRWVENTQLEQNVVFATTAKSADENWCFVLLMFARIRTEKQCFVVAMSHFKSCPPRRITFAFIPRRYLLYGRAFAFFSI